MNTIKFMMFFLFTFFLIGCSNGDSSLANKEQPVPENQIEIDQANQEAESETETQSEKKEVKPTPTILVETNRKKSVDILNTEAIWSESIETKEGSLQLWMTADYQLFASEADLQDAYLQEKVTDNSTEPVILSSTNSQLIAFPHNQKMGLYTFDEGQFTPMLEPVPTEDGNYKTLDHRYLQTAKRYPDDWGGFNVSVYTVDLDAGELIHSILYQLNEKTWDTWLNDDTFTYGFPLYNLDATWIDEILVEKKWKIEKEDIVFRQDYQDILSRYENTINITQELNGVGVLRFPHGLNYMIDGLISGFSTTSSVFTNSTEEVKQIIEDYTGNTFNYKAADEFSGELYDLDYAEWEIYLRPGEDDYWDIYFFEPMTF